MTPGLRADLAALAEVAGVLDSIATRLDRLVGERAARLAPPAVGSDEVSRGVAAAVGRAADEVGADLVDGARQARGFAAALRAQAGAMARADAAAAVRAD